MAAASIIPATPARLTAGGDGGGQRALGRVAGAGLDEPPVPGGEALDGQAGGSRLRRRTTALAQRGQGEPRRAAAGVAGHERQPVDQGRPPVGGVEVREEVCHRHQHGEARAPPRRPVGDPEVEPDPDDGRCRVPRLQEGEDGLRRHEREAALQSLGQAAPVVVDPPVSRLDNEEHVATVDLDRERPGVVGEGVERPPGGQVEAGVVPVAGDEALLDRAPVQGKAHVRAAVVEGVGPAVVPEHADAVVADLGQQASLGLEVVEGADRNAHVPIIPPSHEQTAMSVASVRPC